jgi:uncharacterized protein YjbJ (UPF0337 family)
MAEGKRPHPGRSNGCCVDLKNAADHRIVLSTSKSSSFRSPEGREVDARLKIRVIGLFLMSQIVVPQQRFSLYSHHRPSWSSSLSPVAASCSLASCTHSGAITVIAEFRNLNSPILSIRDLIEKSARSGQLQKMNRHYGSERIGTSTCPARSMSSPKKWRIKVDREHVKGAADKVKGAIKDSAGKVTGDKKLQTEGKIDKAKGAAHNVAGDVKDAVRHATDD